MKLERITGPAIEPLSLTDVRAHLRIDTAADDRLLAALVLAARDACENFLDRALIQQTWRLTLDDWPRRRAAPWWDGVRDGALCDVLGTTRAITLPKGLLGVTTVRTFDAAGAPTTFAAANYLVSPGRNGRIVLMPGAAWPRPGRVADGIEIDFTAGFGAAAADVPQAIRTGLAIVVAHLFEHRGDDPLNAARASGASALWRPYARVRV